MTLFVFKPVDTLFFRDSQPFNSGEGGNNVLESLFPPAPVTLAGALRAALARGQGWKGGPWCKAIKQVLGDGDSLAGLSVSGPYVLQNGALLFPVPRHVFGTRDGKTWKNLTLLAPGRALECDLGDAVRLPAATAKSKDLKTLGQAWVSKAGMEAILAGAAPSAGDIVGARKLIHVEPRTGIMRDPATRTTSTGALYTTRHVRLLHDVMLAMRVDGLPKDWLPDNPAPIGGESRLAWIEPTTVELQRPCAPQFRRDENCVRYTVTLITPAFVEKQSRTPGGTIPGLPGTIVSACIARPQRIGGWASDAGQRGPLPLKAACAAGSIWFMKTDVADAGCLEAMTAPGKRIGSLGDWGYGEFLLGTWREAHA